MGEYDSVYQGSSSDIAKEIQKEAYGEDLGQHSWLTADELVTFASWLKLGPGTSVLDVGCGAGGPSFYLVSHYGCSIEGVDISEQGIKSANERLPVENLTEQAHFAVADASRALPFEDGYFNAVLCVDVMVHLQDRVKVFDELYRVLRPDGKLLYTDAGIIRGIISNEEIARRCAFGFTQFCAPGINEALLSNHGFRMLIKEDVTANVVHVAAGRIRGRQRFEHELLKLEGAERFQQQQTYLESLVALYSNKQLSREVYVAKKS